MPPRPSLSNRWILLVCLAIIVSSILISASPVIAQEWVTLFEDDFESGDLKPWQIGSKGGKAWIGEEPSGNRFLECQAAVFCSAGDLSWSDYALEARFYLVNGSAEFKVRSSSTSYLVRVKQGEWSLWKVKEGTDYKIWELETAPAPIELHTWYFLKILCQGDNLVVTLFDSYWNEPSLSELKYEDKQDSVRSGNIELLTGTFELTSHARFDDVRVNKKASPATGPTSPETTISPTTPLGTSPPPSQPGSSLPIGVIASSVSASIAVCTFTAYLMTRRAQSRQKRYLKKLIDEIDVVYARFKMNARRCEAELYRLKDMITADFKEGKLEEQNYAVLDRRLDSYMKEIQDRILDESLGNFSSKLRDTIRALIERGEVDEYEFAAIEKIILTSTELSEADRARLKDSLERWRSDYLKKAEPSQPDP